jgi:hypothetical protein
MAQTPMDNRSLPGGRDKTPLGNRVLPGKERTPQGTRIISAKPAAKEREAEVDQRLLLLLRSLNLAIAQVSQARELRYTQPEAAIPAGVVDSTLQHLREAQQLAEALKRALG